MAQDDGADGAFWARLDGRIAAGRAGRACGAVGSASPAARARPARDPRSPPAADRPAVADWTGVLDVISAAEGAAREREAQLRERDAAGEALAADLRRSRQEVDALRGLLREIQAQAQARVDAVRAEAEAHAGAVEERARAWVHEAEERARVAEARAEAAEGWLGRIERASRGLSPGRGRAVA